MIIASCKNVMASNFQEYDRTIGTPKAENVERKVGNVWEVIDSLKW